MANHVLITDQAHAYISGLLNPSNTDISRIDITSVRAKVLSTAPTPVASWTFTNWNALGGTNHDQTNLDDVLSIFDTDVHPVPANNSITYNIQDARPAEVYQPKAIAFGMKAVNSNGVAEATEKLFCVWYSDNTDDLYNKQANSSIEYQIGIVLASTGITSITVSVQSISEATKTEMEGGTSSQKYASPRRVKDWKDKFVFPLWTERETPADTATAKELNTRITPGNYLLEFTGNVSWQNAPSDSNANDDLYLDVRQVGETNLFSQNLYTEDQDGNLGHWERLSYNSNGSVAWKNWIRFGESGIKYYSENPEVSATGSGSGAKIQSCVVNSSGQITGVVWESGSSGYATGNVLTFTQGTATATYTLTSSDHSSGVLNNLSGKTIGNSFLETLPATVPANGTVELVYTP